MAREQNDHACIGSAGGLKTASLSSQAKATRMCCRGRRLSHSAAPADAGMTLLEIMIAAGIMATALVLVMSSLANISATGASAEERAIGASHASSVLEEIRGSDQATLLSYRAPAFRGLRRETITVQYVNTAGNLITVPVATGSAPPVLPNPVEVRVTARWQSRSGHPYRVDASTFVRW